MTRLRAALIFFVIWACVYLPGLGSTELKGEEGRRILPAVTMLDTGNWLVPYVGGKAFLRKPPLVNWAIAALFKLTGVRNEWTARLPATLCVLALGLTLIALSGEWMRLETATLAALMSATSFGLLAKARFAGAEIEGIYVPLSGLAMAIWMAWWTERRSPWLVWIVPWIFLGLACLAKGPTLHLLFFYALVVAVVWRARAWRELAHPAHFVGIVLGVGILAAWFVPFLHTADGADALQVWKRQGVDRFTEGDFVAENYFMNFPRGLMDQLPWLLFAPIVWAAQRARGGLFNSVVGETAANCDERRAALRQGTLIATVGCFVVLLLIPGMLPRYLLPLTLTWSVLVAFALENHPARRWVFIGTTILAIGSLIYGSEVAFFLKRYDRIRPVAAQIDAAVPPGKSLIIYDPGYCSEIFYLRVPYRYAPDAVDIPEGAEYVLARAESRKRLARKRPDLVVTHTFARRHDEELLLLQPGAEVHEDARPVVPKSDTPH